MRKFEVLINEEWVEFNPKIYKLKTGDIFRMYNPNGLVEVDGETEFVFKSAFR